MSLDPNDPAAPLPDGLPVRADRRTLAALITHHLFPISPRSLEVWPLTWRHVNGKAVAEVGEAFAIARAKLAAAPPIKGGRRGIMARAA